MVVLIKKLKLESRQRLRVWQSEVNFLERTLHPNIVKMLGHCWKDTELLLVFEFMQRGSLDSHLLEGNPFIAPLSWPMRLKVAIGTARGLDFLHTLENKVIHRDLKASNILLDDDYNAKISIFVSSRWELSDGEWHLTSKDMGTIGYVDPFYVRTGHLHAKSDVYSFGVVLLELMTGLRVLDENRADGQQNLVDWLKPILLHDKKLTNVMDRRMEGQYSSKATSLTAKLAFKCIESNPMNRPSMKEVVDALEKI